MTERIEELIWLELDGELTADQAAELAALRGTAAGVAEPSEPAGQAAAVESEIRRLSSQLAKVEDLEAPPALRGRILSAVEERHSEAGESSTEFRFQRAATIKPVGTRFWGQRGSGFGLSRWGYLAAALIIGAVAYWLTMGPAPGPERASEMVGTVLPAPAPTPEYFRLSEQDSRLAASIDLGLGESTFVFRAPGLEVERVDFLDGARGVHESEAGLISLQASGPGRVELLVTLSEPDQSFSVSVFGDGIEPFEGVFFLHQLSGS